MKKKCWYVDFFEIFGEVRLRKGLDAVIGSLVSAPHSLQPERIPKALGNLCTWPIGTVERGAKLLEKFRPVIENASTDLVENFNGQSSRVGGRLQHRRSHSDDQ